MRERVAPGPLGYTIRDTPEVVARVARDLELAVRAVQAADPALHALVLTGGFARGEGAVLRGEPQNDYDFVALRGLGRPRIPYERVRNRLERATGVAIDLQPVWSGRLRWARPTIFWYETALRGIALTGDPAILRRIRIRDPAALDRGEALRLLSNRAAGLLLAEPVRDPHLHRIQAAKGFLAALDAHLLARGQFAPSQRERWAQYMALAAGDAAPAALLARKGWLAWAFRFKVDPELTPPRDPDAAWRAAGEAILDAVPAALRVLGANDLEASARRDRTLDNLLYRLAAPSAPGARRWAAHPSGRLRVATLALLAARTGRGSEAAAREQLARLARDPPPSAKAARVLEQLRDVARP